MAPASLNELNAELNRQHKLYDRYRLLTVTWEREREQEEDVKRLSNVLADLYDFETIEIKLVPSEDPATVLSDGVRELYSVVSPSESCLCVILYAGGGRLEPEGPVWTCTRTTSFGEDTEKGVKWHPLQDMLATEQSACDVLVLTDCDYGTGVTKALGRTFSSTECSVEVISAPHGFKSSSGGSFTQQLTRVLSDDAALGPVMVFRLLSMLTWSTVDGKKQTPLHHSILRPGRKNITLKRFGCCTNVWMPLLKPVKSDAHTLAQLRTFASEKPSGVDTVRFYERPADLTKEEGLVMRVSTPDNERGLTNWLAKGYRPNWIGLPRFLHEGSWAALALEQTASVKGGRSEEDLESVVGCLNGDLELHKTGETRNGCYDRVVVLPLIWKNTGLARICKVEEDLSDLAHTFRSVFRFEVASTFVLGNEKGRTAQALLEDRLRELVAPLGPDSLLIVMYTGHGNDTIGVTSSMEFTSGPAPGRGHGSEQSIKWRDIQRGILFPAECDVIQLLDCCYAGAATKTTWNGRNELFAATSDVEVVEVPDDSPDKQPKYVSFFTLLRRALEKLARGPAESFNLQTVEKMMEEERRTYNHSPNNVYFSIPAPYFRAMEPEKDRIKLRVMQDEYRSGRGKEEDVVYSRVILTRWGQRVDKYFTRAQLQKQLFNEDAGPVPT